MDNLNGWLPAIAVNGGYIVLYCALSIGAARALNGLVLNNHPATPGIALVLTVLWLLILTIVREIYIAFVGYLAPTHLSFVEGLTLLVATFYLFWARLKKKAR